MLRMFALAPDWQFISYSEVVAWVESVGVDPTTVSRDAFHLTELPDGTYAWHYLEFLKDENGRRITVPDVRDDYQYGEHAQAAKRPRLRVVRALPPHAIEVVRAEVEVSA